MVVSWYAHRRHDVLSVAVREYYWDPGDVSRVVRAVENGGLVVVGGGGSGGGFGDVDRVPCTV